MARVAVIGAGQAGTLAAVGLMNAGHEVTVYRTAESSLNETHSTGTAFIFGDTVAYERKHGVDTFEDRALPADGIHLYFSSKVGQELVLISAFGTRTPLPASSRGSTGRGSPTRCRPTSKRRDAGLRRQPAARGGWTT
jgi:2-polyprenyl-6-methoxyphenol hydroxylase-like FAD-dependent oxidoreductase